MEQAFQEAWCARLNRQVARLDRNFFYLSTVGRLMLSPSHKVLVGVVGFAAVNYLLSALLGDFIYNIGRALVAFAGGWFIVSLAHRNLWAAAAIGPLVMLVDHVILKSGYFVLAHFAFPSVVGEEGLLAAAGVLISFVMFVPIAVAFSFLGGLLSKRRGSNAQANP